MAAHLDKLDRIGDAELSTPARVLGSRHFEDERSAGGSMCTPCRHPDGNCVTGQVAASPQCHLPEQQSRLGRLDSDGMEQPSVQLTRPRVGRASVNTLGSGRVGAAGECEQVRSGPAVE